MKISTFRGIETREVLQQVKEALGEDAVILSTRRVREKNPKTGLPTGPVLIEVTACPGSKPKGIDSRPKSVTPELSMDSLLRGRGKEPEPEAPPPSPRRGRFSAVVDEPLEPSLSGVRAREEKPRAPVAEPPPPPSRFGRMQDDPMPTEADPPPPRRPQEFRRPPVEEEYIPLDEPPMRDDPPPRRTPENRRMMEEPRPVEEPPPATLAHDLSNIRDTLAHLEERVSSLPDVVARQVQMMPDVPGLDAEGKRRYGWLLMHGVEEPIARKLAMVERAVKDGGMEMALRRFLSFRDPLDGNKRVIVMVGPTGVGKTTTLAKIAAELLLNRRRSVGFITLDTFRVGAVAQLETYARLLQVRLVVARGASEVKAGLQSLARCDHVLVDTVGSSPYNRRQVNSTGELLPVLGEDREVLLCMAGNVRETEQKAIFRRFADLNPTGLVFTKLDETVTYGGVLNVALRSRLPLTFYTNGQRVPENLGWLTPEVMAQWFEQARKS